MCSFADAGAAGMIARSGHRIWANDFYLISVGGYNPHPPVELTTPGDNPELDMLLRELWCMNLLTGKWRRMTTAGAPFPREVASFAREYGGTHAPKCIAVCESWSPNTLVYVGGTAVPFGEAATNAVHLLAIESPTRALCALAQVTGLPPQPCYGQVWLLRSCYNVSQE
jgi:hypothetical protein